MYKLYLVKNHKVGMIHFGRAFFWINITTGNEMILRYLVARLTVYDRISFLSFQKSNKLSGSDFISPLANGREGLEVK